MPSIKDEDLCLKNQHRLRKKYGFCASNCGSLEWENDFYSEKLTEIERYYQISQSAYEKI